VTDYLDHILWICADLERGCRRFEELTDVRPRYGGAHVSGATHNALVGLGGRRYLEILAPTRVPQSNADELARLAAAAQEPLVLTYCMRSALPLSEVALRAKAHGGKNVEVAYNGRITPDGATLKWQWLVPKIEPFGFAFPFFIDWLDSIHPSEPRAGEQSSVTLQGFSVGHPRNDELRAILVELGSPVDTFRADRGQFRVLLGCPRGVVAL
jgi:glyoxalase-like protein